MTRDRGQGRGRGKTPVSGSDESRVLLETMNSSTQGARFLTQACIDDVRNNIYQSIKDVRHRQHVIDQVTSRVSQAELTDQRPFFAAPANGPRYREKLRSKSDNTDSSSDSSDGSDESDDQEDPVRRLVAMAIQPTPGGNANVEGDAGNGDADLGAGAPEDELDDSSMDDNDDHSSSDSLPEDDDDDWFSDADFEQFQANYQLSVNLSTNSGTQETQPSPTDPDELNDLNKVLDVLQAEVTRLILCERQAITTLRGAIQAFETMSFPQFSRLPAELRSLIWEAAMPDRVFNLRAPRTKAPNLSSVCKESQAAVVRACRPWMKELKAHHQLTPAESAKWEYYTPHNSIIMIEEAWRNYRDWRVHGTIGLATLRDAAALIVQPPWSVGDVLSLSSSQYKGAQSSFDKPYLWAQGHMFYLPPTFLNKRVNLFAGRTSTVDHRWGRPDLARLLFRGQNILIIDLQDRDEVRRVAGILRQYWQEWELQGGKPHQKLMSRVEQENIVNLDLGKGDYRRWEKTRQAIIGKMQRKVAEEWLPVTFITKEDLATNEDPLLPPLTKEEKAELKEDKARVKKVSGEMVAGMDLRLVHVMQLVSDGWREAPIEQHARW